MSAQIGTASPLNSSGGYRSDVESASRTRYQLAFALLFVAPAFWSANFVVARLATGVIEPNQLAFARWFIALFLMLPFAWRELREHWPAWRREWPDMIVLGGLGMWVCGAFVYEGGQSTTALNIGLIYAMAPVLIACLSAWMFRDRLSPVQIGGASIALTGMVLIVAKGSLDNLLAVRFTAGDLWVLTAVLCWTIYSVLLRRQPTVLGPFARLTAICAGGLLVLLPYTVMEVSLYGLPTDLRYALILAIVVAVLPGFFAYQSYSFMQRELGPAKTGLVLYLGPLYGAVAAWLVLGEAPGWYHAVGAMLILPGIYLATRKSADSSADSHFSADSQ